LKADYLRIVFDDIDRIMPYKKGSSQYVTETLKRGENIMRKRRILPCPVETRSILFEGANMLKLARELQEFLKTKMKQSKP
jgi:hypothetical protein